MTQQQSIAQMLLLREINNMAKYIDDVQLRRLMLLLSSSDEFSSTQALAIQHYQINRIKV